MAHFFWNNSDDKVRYHLANWQMIAQKKEFGGLGVPDLRTLNLSLLAAWIQRYHLNNNVLWKQIVEFKYKTEQPNLFCCPDLGASPFWKGVSLAANAARFGFQWKVGNGRRIRFWEDHWFGTSSLAIQFWHLYAIVNEKGATISQVWDGVNLKLTFRRSVSQNLMLQWEDLCSIASSINLSDEIDNIIWMYDSRGVFSVQTLYSVLSFRGMVPVYIPTMWKLSVPPRIHIFLWLLGNNKLLTRDNLSKRKDLSDKTCLFCNDPESIHHLFFDCCVAIFVWEIISNLCGKQVGADFESVARWWISDKRNLILNYIALLFFGQSGTYEMLCVFRGKNGEVWKGCCPGAPRR